MRMLRVILADDHKVMRKGLHMLVDTEADMEVVGEADDGHTAITLAQSLQPDVVVMDISMPRLNGLKATAALKTLRQTTKILILTRHADTSYVQQLMRSGANGYVLKQSAADELLRAIRQVAIGHTYLDPAVTEQALGHLNVQRVAPDSSSGQDLSDRERDVLRFVAQGFLSKEIAARLEMTSRRSHDLNRAGKT